VSDKLEEKSGDHLTNIETIDKKQAKFFVWLDGRGKNDPELLEKIESAKKLIEESKSIISNGKIEEGVISYKNGSQIHEIEKYIQSEKLGNSLQVWMFSYHWENAPEQTLQQLCLLRSAGQTLEEVDDILHQPHGEYQQKYLKDLQKLYEMKKKLLGEHDRGEIPLEFLQEQFNTLQKLHDIENNPENSHLTSEQQENLRKTIQDLQESNKCCYDNYCEGLKNLQNLQKDQEDKQDEIKVMKKYCDI
jgi:hypothetical protein